MNQPPPIHPDDRENAIVAVLIAFLTLAAIIGCIAVLALS